MILLRGPRIGGTGATLGGLSYAFGGPVLFLYSNAIYLVGAAWLPLGFLAADGWLRRGGRCVGGWLAVVLAMQFLGGDLQTAYALGLFAALYAVWPTPPDRVATGRGSRGHGYVRLVGTRSRLLAAGSGGAWRIARLGAMADRI